jgi:hypothetical protein
MDLITYYVLITGRHAADVTVLLGGEIERDDFFKDSLRWILAKVFLFREGYYQWISGMLELGQRMTH